MRRHVLEHVLLSTAEESLHDLGLALQAKRKSTFLEYFQHRDILSGRTSAISSLRPALRAIAAR
jgi:hypothetical protein